LPCRIFSPFRQRFLAHTQSPDFALLAFETKFGMLFLFRFRFIVFSVKAAKNKPTNGLL
jgi:hypothetical protein